MSAPSAAAVPLESTATASQVALDDRVSGAVEQAQGQGNEHAGAAPAVRLHLGGALDDATPASVSAAVEKPAHANGHSNGASVTPIPSDPSSAPAEPALKAKGLVRQASSGASSAAYTSGTAAHPPPAESPEVRAGFLSRLFFVWLNPIIEKGAKTALMEEDMYAVTPTVDAAGLSALFEKEWAVELARAKDPPHPKHGVYKPNVKSVLYRIFKTPFWIGGICKAFIDGLQFLQPILLEWILAFIFESQTQSGEERPPAWHGYVLAVAIGLNPFVTTVLSNLYFRLMMTIGLRARTILVTQLYKKSLRLSPAAKQTMSVGQVCAHVQRCEQALVTGRYLFFLLLAHRARHSHSALCASFAVLSLFVLSLDREYDVHGLLQSGSVRRLHSFPMECDRPSDHCDRTADPRDWTASTRGARSDSDHVPGARTGHGSFAGAQKSDGQVHRSQSQTDERNLARSIGSATRGLSERPVPLLKMTKPSAMSD